MERQIFHWLLCLYLYSTLILWGHQVTGAFEQVLNDQQEKISAGYLGADLRWWNKSLKPNNREMGYVNNWTHSKRKKSLIVPGIYMYKIFFFIKWDMLIIIGWVGTCITVVEIFIWRFTDISMRTMAANYPSNITDSES